MRRWRGAGRRAWIASILMHGAILAFGLALRTLQPEPVPRGPVRLVAAPTRPPEPAPPGPRSRRPPRIPALVSGAPQRRPIGIPAPPAAELPPPPGSSALALEPWADRSLATWIRSCREGTAQPDSLLEPEPTVQERGRRQLAILLRRDFLRHRREWTEERFREAYARNFPLMR